jgi:hypothetical protein
VDSVPGRDTSPPVTVGKLSHSPDEQEAQAREMLLSLATAEEARRRYVQRFDASPFEM